MKAILYVPAEWKRDPRYADLSRPSYLSNLGRHITRGLQQSAHIFLHCEVPFEFPLQVEWVREPRNPQPTLLIEAECGRSNPFHADFDVVKARLAEVIRQSTLPTVIPDCYLHLRTILETSVHL